MAKKEDKKEADEKPKTTAKNTTNFDWKKALEELVEPNMFKAGLGYYIESNKLEPKSEKDFEKIVTNYGKIKMG